MHVIGLHGAAGSGKSTIARFLVQHYGCVPVAFADPFKQRAVALHGAPIAEVYGLAPKSLAVREFLQLEGTERGRDVHGPDVWVHHALAHLYRLDQLGVTRVVIDDVRFLNEADALRGRVRGPGWQMRAFMGGRCFTGEVWGIRGRGGIPGNHASERPLPDAALDWLLQNGGDLGATRTIVQSYVGARLGWEPTLWA